MSYVPNGGRIGRANSPLVADPHPSGIWIPDDAAFLPTGWPAAESDPYYANTVGIYNWQRLYNGTRPYDGSFAAKHGTGWCVTTAQTSAEFSTTQQKFVGGFSLICPAAGDGVVFASDAAFNFSSGDYAIEGWVYLTAVTTSCVLVDMRPALTNGFYACLYAAGSTGLLSYYVNSAVRIVSASSVSLNVWQHWAVARATNVNKMFIDGVQVGSDWTDSFNPFLQGRMVVGNNAATPGAQPFLGYVGPVRITKGSARGYTTTFTPPSFFFPEG